MKKQELYKITHKGQVLFDNLTEEEYFEKMQVFESGDVQDMCGEDVSFCLDAKEAGFRIMCDPRIRVGHEKTRVI